MTDYQNRQTKAMKGAKQFVLDHPITPANAAVTTASTALTAAITQIDALDSKRITAMGTMHSTAAERQLRKKVLRSALSDLARIAKTLDKTAHPDVAAQLKMGRLGSYASLLAYANNVITVVTPIKQVFIDRGSAATVMEDLQALIDAFVASGERRLTGVAAQLDSHTELGKAVRAGMTQVHALDAILSVLLKPTPGLLTAWKQAKRVRRGPQPDPQEPPAPAAAPAAPSGSPAAVTGTTNQ